MLYWDIWYQVGEGFFCGHTFEWDFVKASIVDPFVGQIFCVLMVYWWMLLTAI